MAAWCEHCDRPVTGEACEVCGRAVEAPVREPIPLRWKFFLVASVIYLGYRLYQLISWLAH